MSDVISVKAVALFAAMIFPASAIAETFYEVDGVVSMEAEHFTDNDGYTFRSDNGPSGQASGWSGDGWMFSDSSAARRMNYSITFTHTGTYWVHLRALAGFNADWSGNVEGDDNGFHAELDGVRISGPGIYVIKPQRWAWFGRFQDGENSEGVSFTVSTPGTHVFSIVRREDLSRLDKIVIHDGTYGTDAASSLSGTGPAETLDPGSATDAGTSQPDTWQPPTDAGGVIPGTTRIEAEHMSLVTYRVEGGASFASNGAMISFVDGAAGESGTATTSFSGVAHHYDVVLAYFDENDGVAQLQVSIDGSVVDSFSLNQDLGDNRASAQTQVRRTVARGRFLNTGATIRINGTEDPLEHARVDYVELLPVTVAPDAGQPDLRLPDVRQPDVPRSDIRLFDLPQYDAASADLTGYEAGSQADRVAIGDDGGVEQQPLGDGGSDAVAEVGCTCALGGGGLSSVAWALVLCALGIARRRRGR